MVAEGCSALTRLSARLAEWGCHLVRHRTDGRHTHPYACGNRLEGGTGIDLCRVPMMLGSEERVGGNRKPVMSSRGPNRGLHRYTGQ